MSAPKRMPGTRTRMLPGEVEVRSRGEVIGWVSSGPTDLLGMWHWALKDGRSGGGCWSKADAVKALRKAARERTEGK